MADPCNDGCTVRLLLTCSGLYYVEKTETERPEIQIAIGVIPKIAIKTLFYSCSEVSWEVIYIFTIIILLQILFKQP
jgi:hypothetical protein